MTNKGYSSKMHNDIRCYLVYRLFYLCSVSEVDLKVMFILMRGR